MAETIINIVLRKLADTVVQEALSLYGVLDKVQRVERELTWIQSFLKDADTKRHKDERVKKWVNEVQEVGYLIEDLLEKFLVEVGGGGDRTEGIPKVLKRMGKMPMKLMAKHKLGNKLDKIQQRICEILENKTKYGIEGLKEASGGTSVDQPIRSFVNPDIDDTEVVGFEVDKKTIVNQLIATNITRRAVISIVGAGGSGKTTLAKEVYKSAEVQRHFDISMWLTISQEYKLINILMKMLEKIQEVADSERQNKEEEYFIIELNKSLKEKKYLVILDDVWSSSVWTQLKVALPNADNGSRVLITTRFIRIVEEADIISNTYKIKPLNEEESKQLLLKKVFPNRFANECPNEVLHLAIQFTKKCGGWPLPLVVVGGILSTKNSDYITWDEVMQKMDWQTDGSSFMGVISTSYEYLPTSLKLCFMYFGVFPEDYQIKATILIQLWIAEGFIPQDGTKLLEDIAESYLEELVQRCMVQVSSRSCIGKIKYCHIHDLLGDLAIKKAKEDNFLMVVTKNDTKVSSGTCAHRVALHGDGNKMIEHPCSKNLRSSINFQNVPNIQNFKTLRILHMSRLRPKYPYSTNCMKGLSSLTTLKYIGFECGRHNHGMHCSFPTVRFEGSPLTNLMNLQTVRTWLCESQVKLPPSFWGNKQLRHINVYCIKAAPEGPPSAADLQCLRALKWVKARQDWVAELPNFPNIRKLGIIIPEDVEREPLINMLSNLNNLGSFYLFTGTDNVMAFPDCISAFRNHNRLHSFYHFYGRWPRKEVVDCTRFPPHLVKLTLSCFDFEEDPMPQLEKLPNLRVLILVNSLFCKEADGKCQMICSRGGFGCLQRLELDVYNLTEWKIEEGAMRKLNQLRLICGTLQHHTAPDLQYLVNLQELDLFCAKWFEYRLQEEWNIKNIPSVRINDYSRI